jgi:hypothetical protein
MSVEGEVAVSGGGLVSCGAAWEMEVCWPSRAGLRKQALNHHKGLWLKTVVLNVVETTRQRSRQVWTGKMSDEREFSAVDVSKAPNTTSKPGPSPCPGMNLGDSRLLPRWCPAYRQHEPGRGSHVEHVKARTIPREPHPKTWGCGEPRGRIPSGRIREGLSTVAGALADSPVVAVNRLRIAVGRGAKGRGCPGERVWSTERDGAA